MPGIFEDTLTMRRPGPGVAPLPAPGEAMARTWVGTPEADVPRQRLSTELKMMVAAFAVLTGLMMAAFVTFRAIRDYSESSASVARQLDVLASLHSLNASLGNNHTELMAYVLDQDPARLAEVKARAAASGSAIERLAPLVVDPVQRDRMAEAMADVEAINQLHAQAVASRSAEGAPAALDLLTSPAATDALMRLGSAVEGMVGRERQLFLEQQDLEKARRRHVVWNFGLVLLLFLGTTALLFGHIRYDLRIRTRIGRDRDAVRKFLEAIITAIPHPILIKDAATLNYVLVNPAMATLLGQPSKNALEKSDFTFFEPERAARAQELDRQALDLGTLSMDEVNVPTAQRGERTFRTIRLPFTVPASKQGYLLTIAEDITDILQSQGQVVAANRLLRRQAEELRAANNELSNFSYTVSHDLRTPLRAIDGFAEMLADDYADALDDRGRRYISVVRESSQRMGELIDALLYYTRIGREPLNASPVNMNQLVSGAKEAVSAAFPDLAIEWHITSVPDACGDRDLLRQVWTNLLMNAAKFSQESARPVITVSGSTDGEETAYSVSDNGVGFDMQFYSKLFGLFQRLHTVAPYAGPGVGLAIVHRVVAHHGGRSWANGIPGDGATFFFALPAVGKCGCGARQGD